MGTTLFVHARMVASSILMVFAIAAAALILTRVLAKYWKDKFKTVEDYTKNKLERVVLSLLLSHIAIPMVEELTFRAPLVMLFSSVSIAARVGIIFSAIAFALIHLTNPLFLMPSQITKKKNGDWRTGDLQQAIGEAREENQDLKKYQKIAQPLGTFILGILAGYFAIAKQSIWAAVVIHVIWNLFMPFILGLAFLGIYLLSLLMNEAFIRVKTAIEIRVGTMRRMRRLKKLFRTRPPAGWSGEWPDVNKAGKSKDFNSKAEDQP